MISIHPIWSIFPIGITRPRLEVCISLQHWHKLCLITWVKIKPWGVWGTWTYEGDVGELLHLYGLTGLGAKKQVLKLVGTRISLCTFSYDFKKVFQILELKKYIYFSSYIQDTGSFLEKFAYSFFKCIYFL